MSNKIEKIVRHYVKKMLAEVVKDLDVLIEQKVQIKLEQRLDLLDVLSENKTRPSNLHEVYSAPSRPQPPPRGKLTARDLGISEDTWKSVYAGVQESGNPILDGAEEDEDYYPTSERPEYVPERVMEQAGFMRDFSRHVDAFDAMDRNKSPQTPDEDAQSKYREALSKIQYG